ncbi:MAG: branched-chain-amino-acid transaminase [Thermaerobacter sp.]|nr:branched-chain-amino-acid transaminase [Thermaerobacter sp.]
MSLEIYLDGEFVPEEQARVSVYDHGFLYGDGVFEGIRAYNGRVFRLAQHIDRLYESAKSILLEIPVLKEDLAEAVVEACRRNAIRDGYIRVVVSRGKGDLGLDPRKCPRATVVVIADVISIFPEEVYREGMSVITVATRRSRTDALNPQIKTLNYLNSIMAKLEANLAGKPEVLLLNAEGLVVEGTGDNVFIVRRGHLVTPPTWLGILEGITRRTVLELAKARGIAAVEAPFTAHDVYNAQECFLTGTAAEVVPVVEVDGRRVGEGQPGTVTRQLIDAYRELVNHEGTEIFVEEALQAGLKGGS